MLSEMDAVLLCIDDVRSDKVSVLFERFRTSLLGITCVISILPGSDAVSSCDSDDPTGNGVVLEVSTSPRNPSFSDCFNRFIVLLSADCSPNHFRGNNLFVTAPMPAPPITPPTAPPSS